MLAPGVDEGGTQKRNLPSPPTSNPVKGIAEGRPVATEKGHETGEKGGS